MKQKSSKANRSRFLGIVCMTVVVLFGLSSCRPDYDLDTTMPANLGSSIYEFLKEEGFDTYVKLIEDLNYKDVLAKTGSKTLFVADEAAVQRFYESGVFKKADGSNVTCYEDLSLAQKKMILYGSMLNNVYQAAALSTTEGPTIGRTMRREASNSIYDTLPVITAADMPIQKLPEAGTDYWKMYRREGKSITTFAGDMSQKPMVLFTPKFMEMNKITDDDFDFLFNQGTYSEDGSKPARQPSDVTVNGVKIIEPNRRCFNGFVHVTEDVIYSLPNMADYLNDYEGVEVYNALLQRFSVLEYVGDAVMTDLRDFTGTQDLDSVYEYRFFSERNYNFGSSVEDYLTNLTYDGIRYTENKKLKFDPAWNAYNIKPMGSISQDVAMQQDMAVMLVPTNEAMKEWWDDPNGGGYVMKQSFGKLGRPANSIEELIEDMQGLPDDVVLELLINNQLSSLVGSVPSKFSVVLDDARDPMGIETDDISSVAMCCNGAIYFTDKVFSPAAYRAVSYPALVLDNLEIINWAINEFHFDDYLKSMSVTYSFFIPTVQESNRPELNGKLMHINPLSFARTTKNDLGEEIGEIAVFSYDKKLSIPVTADLYQYNLATGEIGELVEERIMGDAVESILSDLLDYHIVIGSVEEASEYEYFQTKGRGTVKIGREGGDVKHVFGGFDLDKENPQSATVIARYDMKTTSDGNGVAYILDRPVQTSRRSVYDVLADSVNYPEFNEFYKLMLAATSADGKDRMFETVIDDYAIGSARNISVFNTYHYTIYVPTNESIIRAMNEGRIISPDSIENFRKRYDDMLDEVDRLEGPFPEQAEALMAQYTADMAKYSEEATGVVDAKYNHNNHCNYLGEKIMDFVKYHIQDNSLYIGGEFKMDQDDIDAGKTSKSFETAFLNKKNNQFLTLSVNVDNQGIHIKDAINKNVTVQKKNGQSGKALYNIMCREYVYNVEPENIASLTKLYTSSYAVIHQIDEPLEY